MKLNFKEWIEPSVKNKKRLVVYDFDGTIANVPEKPSDWNRKNGDWWGHPLSLSNPNYNNEVNHEVIANFKKDKADPNTHVILLTGRRGEVSPSVRNVLRTHGLFGKRMIPNSNEKILGYHQNNISSGLDVEHPEEQHGHEEYYAGDHSTEPDYPKGPKGKADGSTLAHKIYIIRNKMMHPGIEQVEFWDDRSDHIPHFIKLGLDLLKEYGVQAGGNLKNVILHRVYPPTDRSGQGTIQHIPIKPGMNH